ncbi:MAG: hypothetical protein L0Y55_08135 [Anaerolineales bacterium]|nr:hypothetical protein [Anaerolineales bacterium]
MKPREYFLILIVTSVLALGLAACSSGTPAGPLGAPIDLRPRLPADVRARAPSDTDWGKFQTAQTQIKVGDPAATVAIAWKYFKDGARSYLLDVSFQVLAPVEGIELSAMTEGAPIYAGSVQAIRVVVTWSRASALGTQSGMASGMILADGRWELAQ